jgi:sugar phosphate isomerase/epimerase
MYNFKFGISSWSYPWSVGVAIGPQPLKKMTALDILKKAKALNIGLVQIADNLPLENFSKTDFNEFVAFATDNQIAIEVGTKGTEVDHLLKFLEICIKLKSQILRTLPALFSKKAVMHEVEKNIREVLPKFQEAGVTIVLENTEAFKAQEYADLIERVNHPNFRMCLDLANALGTMEGPEYVLDKLIPYCGNYHFKDIVVVRSQTLMGFTVQGKPSGQGQLSLTWVLDELNKRALSPSVIIELWPPFQENIEATMLLEDKWVKESADFMRSVMKK